ncbi:hypothetical protein B0H34DRAFT_185951 [Crassisporium funariophilum]|nr:hypothetical protein B0H34DRAFT_185951 [Crassisporium funariophilum]
MDHMDTKPWNCGERWRHPVPNPKPEKRWEKCRDLVDKYDDEMLKAWKGEVDNLLIFAGLFSATVTSFTVESYKWLDEAHDDMSIRILAHISQQLSQGLQNVSGPVPPPQEFNVSSSAVRINIFWFLSLTLSMATVLVGILCMQWLREFQRDAARSHKDALAIRQMRYEGLLKWRVPLMLSLLPLILQTALVLFFAGVLELLWSRNQIVATIVSVAAGLVCLFLVGTTVLPAFQSLLTTDPHLRVGQCPYKSPQSWAFYRLTLRMVHVYGFILTQIATLINLFLKQNPLDMAEEAQDSDQAPGLSRFGRFVEVNLDKNWIDYDIRWRFMRDATFLDEAGNPCEPQDGGDITWLDQTFTEDVDAVYLVFHCLLDLPNPQAAQVVADLDPDVAYLVKLLYPTDAAVGAPIYHSSPAPDTMIREHIFAVFLWLHKHIHPSLTESYLENTIRLMNTNSQCIPLLALRQSDTDLQGLSQETIFQLFNSFKCIIANKSITIQHGSDIWALLRDLHLQETEMATPLLRLTFDIFEHFHQWLTPPDKEQVHRVEICVVGIIRMSGLMDSPHVDSLRAMKSFKNLERLVLDLDALTADLQDNSALLRGLKKRRWPELMRKIFPVPASNSASHLNGQVLAKSLQSPLKARDDKTHI